MENNIDLIRKKVLEVKKNCLLVKENLPIDKQLDAQIKVSDYILSFIDSLQEEPKDPCKDHVSEELETELDSYIKDNFTIDKEQLDRFGIDEKDYMYSMDKSDMLAMVRQFAEWQHNKDEKSVEDIMATAYANGMADMRHQLLKNAIGSKVIEDAGGYPCVACVVELYDYDKDIPLAKKGDKVKIVVIKEEE